MLRIHQAVFPEFLSAVERYSLIAPNRSLISMQHASLKDISEVARLVARKDMFLVMESEFSARI